jgi:non-ribosomal peptide synthetase component E (peptide arylation enzyme)
MACGSHVFIPKFVPDDVLDAIEKHRVNRAMMVPAMIAMMLQAASAGTKQRDLTCLGNV